MLVAEATTPVSSTCPAWPKRGYHLARPMPADEVTRWLYAGTGTAPHRLGR
jgi:hypothetical protein